MKNVRAHVIVDGRVQGVCFRMETRRAAFNRKLKGWVKNLSDGRVEAVFEGEMNDVKSMIKWCQEGPPLARVGKVSVEWEDYTGVFDSFEITFA